MYTHDFATAGGVVSGDIKLSIGSDLVRSLGCNDLSAGKKFTLLLGTDTNMQTYTIPNSGLPVPINIKTDVGFCILINEFSQIFKRPIPYDICIWFPASGWTRNFRLDYIELP